MKRVLSKGVVVVLLLFSQFGLSQQAANEWLEDMDAYIESSRLQWETPGLAVAIVHDGEIILSKGYGKKQLGSAEPVDGKTIFSVGSTTKAMTAACLAMLIDEGKANWNDPVIDHLPFFKLKDPYATRELTLKDLFTHNSGVGNADNLWVLFDYETKEIVERLQHFEPRYSFRGGYTYQNIMYAAAGLVIEELSGMPWSQYITERLFEPLGMSNTFALRDYAFQQANRSIPHDWVDGEIAPIPDSYADRIGAAGSVWSCTDDIVKWMNFVLDSSKIDGQRLISTESFETLHEPHIVIPKEQFYPTAALTKPRFTTYSLGWFQHDYQGQFVHFHTGSLSGTVAIIGLLPEHNFGVYVFGNLDHTELRHALMYKAFDMFLNHEERDWSTEVKNLYDGFKQQSEIRRQKMIESRVTGTTPSRELSSYTGEYINKEHGSVEVTTGHDGSLHIRFRDDRNLVLDHWHYDTFLATKAEYPQDRGSLLQFNSNTNGINAFEVYGYTFTKKQ